MSEENRYDLPPIEVDEKPEPLNLPESRQRLNRKERRRNARERREYDDSEGIEREQNALEKLESPYILNEVLPRFYEKQYGKDISDLTDLEKISLYYEDRIGAYHNTYKAGDEIYEMKYGKNAKDNEHRADWAELTQLYEDIPSFGGGQIGFMEWAYHFLPEFTLKDPTFYIGIGAGKLATSMGKSKAIKEAVDTVKEEIAKAQIKAKTGKETVTLTDDEIIKNLDPNLLKNQMFKKTLKWSAAVDGGSGLAIGMLHDAHAQYSEIEAGLTGDSFDRWRMLKNGVVTGSIGVLTSGTISGLSLKGSISRYYDDPETGFLRDVKQELGDLDFENNVSYQFNSKTGEIDVFPPTKREQTSLGSTVETKDKSVGVVTKMSKDGKKATVQFADEDGKVTTKTFNTENVKFVSKPEASTDPNVLPPSLSKASPRYNYGQTPIDLDFEDDITKALYIVGGKGQSAKHADYLAFLDNAGVENITEEAAKVRKQIKDAAKAGETSVTVKKQYKQKSLDIKKPDESPLIQKKAEEIKRSTEFLNWEKIDANPEYKNALKQIMTDLAEKGIIRGSSRKHLIKFMEERGKELQQHDMDYVFKKLKQMSDMGDDAGAIKLAADMDFLASVSDFKKLRDMIDEAVTDVEKVKLAEVMKDAVIKLGEKASITTGATTAASDIMQSGKIIKNLSEVEKLKLERRKILGEEIIPDLKVALIEMTPDQQIATLAKLGEHMDNPFMLQKLNHIAKLKAGSDDVTFGQAFNEVITGNLLLDYSTHVINGSSAGIKTATTRVEDYAGGLLYFGKTGSIDLLRMMNDVNMTNKFVYGAALEDALLAFKLQRNVGDALEHKFDQPRQLMANTYLEQHAKSKNIVRKTLLNPYISTMAKFSNFAFKTLGMEDTFIKALTNRAYRIAHVNQRMRKFYPELWKQKPKDVTKTLGEVQKIKNLKRDNNYELSLDNPDYKKIQANNDLIKDIEPLIDNSDFAKKYRELFYQYEDEFGNWRFIKDFSEDEASSLDDLTKSMAYDPMYVARENTFTNNPAREIFEPSQFFPKQTPNDMNISGWAMTQANKKGGAWVRVFSGLHFMKTPNNLVKDFAVRTPAINLLTSDWHKMMKAEDPIVRNKAHAITSIGMLATAAAYYTFSPDNYIGMGHPDPKKRHTFTFTEDVTDEDGNTKQLIHSVNIGKYLQFAPQIELAADLHYIDDTIANMSQDPIYSADIQLIEAALSEHFQQRAAYMNHRISNQMFFREFSNMLSIITKPDSSLSYKLESFANNFAAKLVPASTLSRSINRTMAEARPEIDTMRKKLIDSTPYSLIKYVDEEMLGGKMKGYYADMAAPQRDIFHNPFPPKSALHAIPMEGALSNLIYDRKGNKIDFSKPQAETLIQVIQTSNISPMADVYKLKGTGKYTKALELREYEIESFTQEDGSGYEFVSKIDMPEHTSLYQGMKIIARNITLSEYDDRTLNEQIAYEITQPYSTFNTQKRNNRMIAGEYEGGAYIKQILNDYNEAARDHMKAQFKFKIGGNIRTIDGLDTETESILQNLLEQ